MKSAFAVELDTDLIHRAQSGDRAALYEIYTAFEKPLYSLGYRFSQCPEQAQDILQEGMLCLVEKIGQYRFEGPFWGWARRLFINSALMYLRRHHKRQENIEVLVDEQAIGVVGSAEMARDIATAFARLAPERRVVLWLYAVEGYTHQEIAAFLGHSESYSKTQLMRARRQVRQWWQLQNDEEDVKRGVGDDHQ